MLMGPYLDTGAYLATRGYGKDTTTRALSSVAQGVRQRILSCCAGRRVGVRAGVCECVCVCVVCTCVLAGESGGAYPVRTFFSPVGTKWLYALMRGSYHRVCLVK